MPLPFNKAAFPLARRGRSGVLEKFYNFGRKNVEHETSQIAHPAFTSLQTNRYNEGMKVAIIGYGVEGKSALHYWQDKGADVTICDHKEELALPSGVHAQLGTDYLRDLDRFDVIMRSAGIPSEVITRANPKVKGKITTTINEFLRACPTKQVIGVTGTKGKGTTSTLIAQLLEAAGHKVFLGGNIGISPFDFIDKIGADDWVVLELSSYQLSDMKQRVHIGVCLMVEGEHLNWHKTMDAYAKAKMQLFAHQKPEDVAIYYADNLLSHQIASASPGDKIAYYDTPGAYIVGKKIMIDNYVLCKTDELKLLGRHNWQNVCAAVTAAWQVAQAPDAYTKVLTTFTGLPHRLEFVREAGKVKYFNDSFASAPPAAEAAITAIKGKKVMIMGGFDRDLPLDKLVATLKKHSSDIRSVLLIGQSAARLSEELRAADYTNFKLSRATTMKQIVRDAHGLAKPGDSVVLSPGFPSFDMFKDFEERGLLFKQEVTTL